MAKHLRRFLMGEKRNTEEEEEEIPSNIPHDVIIDAVLPRLPVKSLLRFSSVCKLWFNSIINQSNLVSSHLLHSQKHPTLIFIFLIKEIRCNPPSMLGKNSTIHLFSVLDHKDDLGKVATITTSSIRFHVIGFCNGLVCLRNGSTVEVCNPSRREVLFINSPPNHPLRSTSGFGFGFDPLSNEYKVVSITKDYKCIIYTLGSSCWREISGPNPNPVPRRGIRQIDLPILSNGVMFWRTMDPPQIVALDLHSEEFQVIPIPFKYSCYNDYHHLEYKGTLCLARLQRPEDYKHNCTAQLQILDRTNQVWVEENICIPFRYPIEHTIRFVGFSDQALLCSLDISKFRLYNLHSKNVIEVNELDYRTFGLDYHLISHVENFLSLRTLMQHSGSFCRITSLNAYFDDEDHIFKI